MSSSPLIPHNADDIEARIKEGRRERLAMVRTIMHRSFPALREDVLNMRDGTKRVAELEDLCLTCLEEGYNILINGIVFEPLPPYEDGDFDDDNDNLAH